MPKDSKGKAAVRGADSNATTDSPARNNAKPYHKRSAPSGSSAISSSSKGKPSHPNKKQKYEKPQSASSALPGASKIKSSIRQTKRLLAKPNLAPGTRIEAERRLKSLEADLELASRKQVEKSRASRYHRIKFVERQKLVRRIARCRRNLARIEKGGKAADDSGSEAGSDDDEEQKVKESNMSKEELVKMLGWLRELLQYVVQYPADLRYVALFPNAEEGPIPPDAKEKDKSRQKAYQHLERVKEAIKDGKLSAEPEVELSNKDRPRTKLANSNTGIAETEPNGNQKSEKKAGKAAKSKRKHKEPSSDEEDEEDAGGVKGDDFFAQDSDDQE
ncbi:probable rRNA-processing protein EFG1 [Ustilago trichophora]|uniref:rRNA-processing protein EFG1 n=1 Tax=Ustilago trichophora TaxID=86804 RepID=A0A5C3DZY3_9BASI|nr:probable rRNA-processing protein EFG1 [Ustilago trichophora]